MFGPVTAPQNEDSRFHPRSPYAIAKVFAHHTTINYRESYGMFAVSGMLFNHESERRGLEFVTRKITYNVARIALGLQKSFSLGTMDAKRDWGYAPEYVEAMHRMLQLKEPTDFVIGTGVHQTVEEFLVAALKAAKLSGGIEKYVKSDPKFVRPAEVNELRADTTKAKRILKWAPKTTFEELVLNMVTADLLRLKENSTFVPAHFG